MPFILDASVAASWAFDDEKLPLAQKILERLNSDEAIVPALWWFEILNIMAVNERRGRISAIIAARFLSLLRELEIGVDYAADHGAILSLARQHRLTGYDAAYLELAIREGLPLATLDKELAKAAAYAGVRLLSA
ncbi:type II toxin-antitoxin system VapC family toxin [Niveispirillum sp. KHB5.9]|uniref:type II toxin-antitoxin system VapC family toxin n=1 Tax=Niveispirillum sp. KHB5.9 TaxID=3400269 RepID=UPI003A8C5868